MTALTVLVMTVVALPFLALIGQLYSPEYDIWTHLADTVLKRYLADSLMLSAGTVTSTLIIGITTAWLCSVCEFRGRRFFEWVVILPLAYPAYIVAYAYAGIFDYGGSVHGWLHSIANVSTPLPIRSLGGTVMIMSLAFYPYVYLLVRASFLYQSPQIIEAGRILGARPRTCFLRIAIPVARPGIIAGAAIVMMETLADYGAARYLGVNTFSVGIFRTWFGLGSITGAAQLSVLLLVFVVALVVLEKQARKRVRYYGDPAQRPFAPSYHLRGIRAAAAIVACALPPTFGFLVPTLQLSAWASAGLATTRMTDYLVLVSNSFGLALVSLLIILVIAVVVAYAKHLHMSSWMKVVTQMITSGYAIPGGVVAIGVLIFFSKLDDWTGIALVSGFSALIFSYIIRFLTLGFNSVDSVLEKTPLDIGYAAKSLGASGMETLVKVHLPLIRTSLLTAGLLVFVEVIKELPATLVLRPFNFNTLAVRAFEFASDERLIDTALPALSIAAVGVLPLIVLAKIMHSPRGAWRAVC